MNRRKYRSTRSTTPAWVRTTMIILGIFFLFLAFVAIFRRQGPADVSSSVRSSDDIVAELIQDSAKVQGTSPRETPRGIPESTVLLSVSGGSASATAKRVFENNLFTHTILGQDLPLIDEGKFHYQAWLIRPYPFDFFDTSPLIHNADGSWGMIWVGSPGEAYDDFIEVLVTREPIGDFDENPSTDQILKGAF